MGDVGDEAPPYGLKVRKGIRHMVKGNGELGNFVLPLDGNPDGEVALGKALRCRRHYPKGLSELVGHEIDCHRGKDRRNKRAEKDDVHYVHNVEQPVRGVRRDEHHRHHRVAVFYWYSDCVVGGFIYPAEVSGFAVLPGEGFSHRLFIDGIGLVVTVAFLGTDEGFALGICEENDGVRGARDDVVACLP